VKPGQDSFGRAWDAVLFDRKGCPSGLEDILPRARLILGDQYPERTKTPGQ